MTNLSKARELADKIEPKEKPIIFSAPMIRAILSGAKSQTRRVIKPQPLHIGWFEHQQGWCAKIREGHFEMVKCPYTVGQRLWVRETWATGKDAGCPDFDYFYRATDPGWDDNDTGLRWRPSIYMPRKASRITLEVVSVRAERLQDISEADVRREGAGNEVRQMWLYGADAEGRRLIYANSFRGLWQSINGKTYPWESNRSFGSWNLGGLRSDKPRS